MGAHAGCLLPLTCLACRAPILRVSEAKASRTATQRRTRARGASSAVSSADRRRCSRLSAAAAAAVAAATAPASSSYPSGSSARLVVSGRFTYLGADSDRWKSGATRRRRAQHRAKPANLLIRNCHLPDYQVANKLLYPAGGTPTFPRRVSCCIMLLRGDFLA